MKEFSDFEEYWLNHSLEFSTKLLSNLSFETENINFSQEELKLVETLALRSSMALIQQYHEWLSELPDESHQ